VLEEALKVSPFIANIVLYGANKPHNVAVVVVEKDAIARWATETGISVGDVCSDHRVRRLLQDELDRLGAPFKSFERVKGVLVIDEDFTPDNGLLTPKLSVKRREVVKKYQAQLDALYLNK
jgi:long-chain acyl-CoA synthetase